MNSVLYVQTFSFFFKNKLSDVTSVNNFPIKIEAIVRNVGNLRIKEVLLIAKLHHQINYGLELNTEYIIN